MNFNIHFSFRSLLVFTLKVISYFFFLVGVIVILFILFFYAERWVDYWLWNDYYHHLYQNSKKTSCDFIYLSYMNKENIILFENLKPAQCEEVFLSKFLCNGGTTFGSTKSKECQRFKEN